MKNILSRTDKPRAWFKAHFIDDNFFRKSLLGSTLFFVGIAATLAAAVFILITLTIIQPRIERQANKNLEELIESMRSMAAIACFAKDAKLAEETVQAFIQNSNVFQASIIGYGMPLANATRSGALVIEDSVPTSKGNTRPRLTRPLFSPFDPDENIGTIELVPNWSVIDKEVASTVRQITIMLVLLAIGIVGTIALVITILVVHPVKKLSDRLHALNAVEGETLHIPAQHKMNEFGRLVEDINELLSRFWISLERVHELHLQQVINERMRLSSAVFEHAQEGITITDRQNHIISVNRAFTQITGFSEVEVIGENPNILTSGKHDKTFYEEMWHSINTLGFWRGELWNRTKNGQIKPNWVSINVVRDENDEIVNHIAIFSDISERKQTEKQIEFLAHHDALTKLPNRILTRDRFEQAVAGARRDGTGVVALYVDLDNFKYINDTFGHQAGDQLLLLTAERLKRNIRDTDTISRQGGDEFLIILPKVQSDEIVQRIAQLILSDISSSFEIEGHTIGISASIGIARYPEHGNDFDSLLKNADAAMYAAKASGKNVYQIYSEEMNVDALDKLKLKAQLRSALTRKEFQLFFQPQVNITSRRIVGAEALIRWNHPEHGIVLPGRFISLAEESGMISEIGSWVIDEACRQGKQWFDTGVPPFVIAVNISAQQFNKGTVFDVVRDILNRTSFPAEFLELEFTESGLLIDIQHSLSTIESLRTLGVKLSIDDFGTGYSSLSYLKQFKIEKLKIDQSFIRDIVANVEDTEIVRAIIQLSKTLRLNVIAEGVETEEQFQVLNDLECVEAQGYLISHPLPSGDFEQFIAAWPLQNDNTVRQE